ncbi:MAG: TM2 domain-containing protein [Oscillospiraceae bacterium]|nr:TM2 domain-containing protein [Oscillospiraceae bacterium]
MFCKNCGNQIDPNAAVCVKCGVGAGQGFNFCPNCGANTVPNAAVCVKCGVPLHSTPAAGNKSKLTAGLLGIFLGGLGVHNFYLGRTGIGIAQIAVTLITCGAGAIWGFIEGILILCGKIDKDAKGNLLTD